MSVIASFYVINIGKRIGLIEAVEAASKALTIKPIEDSVRILKAWLRAIKAMQTGMLSIG